MESPDGAPGIETYAFEPNPETFQKLCIFKHPKMHPINAALGDQDGTLLLHLHGLSDVNSFVYRHGDYTRSIPVSVTRLDSATWLPRIGLIKIDTEGYELPVLRGAVETLRRNRPRLVVEIHPPYQRQLKEVSTYLRGPGFTCKVVHRRRYGQPHLVAWYNGRGG